MHRKISRAGSLAILLLIGAALVLAVLLSRPGTQPAVNQADSPDKLAYVSDDHHLMLYDPRDRTETMLLQNVASFVLGRDGRVAFTWLDENATGLYVFNPATPATAPIRINPTGYPLAWSQDGRYLALGAHQDDEYALYVWDGESITNIMPDDTLDAADWFYVDWSHDGRLAFTIQYGWSMDDTPSEIYVWDGNTTVNLSQNPEEWDGGTYWSGNGQLMFTSYHDEEREIYVWDGVSFKDGAPDVTTFIHVAPELQPIYPTWAEDNIVAFTVYPDFSPSGVKEIVLWDVEREAIVREIPVSSENYWSWLAEGGQVIVSTHLASGIPSYRLDVEDTEGAILFSANVGEISWSADGYLAYCETDDDSSMMRILSIWDGETSWEVATVSYKPVRWQNGRSTFSCNNG